MQLGHSNPGYKHLMDNQYLQEVSDEIDVEVMITNDLEVSCTNRGSMQESFGCKIDALKN